MARAEFSGLSLDALLEMYNAETVALREKLLKGESWGTIKHCHKRLTELAISIYVKRPPLSRFNPSEYPYKNTEVNSPGSM